jgi:uncharacterized membrane protein
MTDSVSKEASRLDRASVVHSQAGKFETWVVRNSDWLAIAMILAAFVVRLAYASSCYLNPDEAQHFNAARPFSWLGAYEASYSLAHPPLFILVLHAFLFLGRSETILRLPSVIGGTVALWFAFAWIRRSLGEIPALTGLLFMMLSPAAISASTEVRQYGLLLCFICGALYATERTLNELSIYWAVVQGFFLLCALLTHYTALVVIFSLGLYSLLRCILDSAPRRVLLSLVAVQLVLSTVFGWLYLEHVRQTSVFDPASLSYLGQFYYVRGSETLFGFCRRALIGTFSYMMGHRMAIPLIFVYLSGIAALLVGRNGRRRSLASLIVFPFAVGFVTAIFHVFPFVGSRHQTYLLPFLAEGIAAGLTWMPRGLVLQL